MPVKPLNAQLTLCEKVLQEADGVMSAIRIVDAFHVDSNPLGSNEISVIGMHILVICKFPYDDESNHTINLRLKRPNGEEKDIPFANSPFEVSAKDLKPPIPGLPCGFSLKVPWGVIASQMGTHELYLLVDGELAARSLFTLIPQSALETAL